LREGDRQRIFKNVALRNVFPPKAENIGGTGENSLRRSFITCTPREILLG
jgi:hypothetical protein